MIQWADLIFPIKCWPSSIFNSITYMYPSWYIFTSLQLTAFFKYLIFILREFNYIKHGWKTLISVSIVLHKYQLLPRLLPIYLQEATSSDLKTEIGDTSKHYLCQKKLSHSASGCTMLKCTHHHLSCLLPSFCTYQQILILWRNCSTLMGRLQYTRIKRYKGKNNFVLCISVFLNIIFILYLYYISIYIRLHLMNVFFYLMKSICI